VTATLGVGILGAGGTIAPAIVRDLAESEEVGDLLLLDLDAARAEAVADEHGLGKAGVRAVDARADLASALAGLDILVNAASYRVNLDAMRACLAAGTRYLDLGGLYWLTGRQLELDEEFRRAGLLAILGIGSSPGKTNVMAVRAVRELGETPRAIDVMAAGRDLDPPRGGASFPYALQTLVDEATIPPIVVRDARPVEIDALSSGGVVEFGEPIGAAETIHTLHSELRTFPESFGCTEASFRLSLPEPVLARLRELSNASADKIAAAAAEALPPSANTVSVHVVEATAENRVVRLRAVTRPIESWRLGGGVVSTGAPAAAAVRLIARGLVDGAGVHPPEACIDPDDLFPELERHGTTFDLESRKEAYAA
jgi:saccharopine dehydrogenase-like NADP-dependent oxidoreductase